MHKGGHKSAVNKQEYQNNRHDVMKTTERQQHNDQYDNAADSARVSVLVWLRLGSSQNLVVVVLLLAVLLTALAVVDTSYRHRMTFHQLQQSRVQTNDLDVQWGQLLIEQSTFGLEGRIERRASEELGMKVPDWSKIVMVRHE